MAKRREDYTAADHARLILDAMDGGSRTDLNHPDRDFLNNRIDHGGKANGAAMLNVLLLAGVTRLEIDNLQERSGTAWDSHRNTIRSVFFDGIEVIEEYDIGTVRFFRFDRAALRAIRDGM